MQVGTAFNLIPGFSAGFVRRNGEKMIFCRESQPEHCFPGFGHARSRHGRPGQCRAQVRGQQGWHLRAITGLVERPNPRCQGPNRSGRSCQGTPQRIKQAHIFRRYARQVRSTGHNGDNPIQWASANTLRSAFKPDNALDGELAPVALAGLSFPGLKP